MSQITKTFQDKTNAVKNTPSNKPGHGYNVTVFAASSMMNDPGHAEDAKYVGRELARRGYHLLYGGGSLGLMGIVSQTVLDEGGKITGYMMDCFIEGDETYPQKDYEEVATTIAERKEQMILNADAYIVLGGGFGTLDEIMEAGVEQYLGGYANPPVQLKPIILVNRNGIYDPLMAQLDKFVAEGSMRAAAKDFFTLVKDGQEAIKTLDAALAAPAKPSVPVGNVDNKP